MLNHYFSVVNGNGTEEQALLEDVAGSAFSPLTPHAPSPLSRSVLSKSQAPAFTDSMHVEERGVVCKDRLWAPEQRTSIETHELYWEYMALHVFSSLRVAYIWLQFSPVFFF